ncbi:putative PEP-binding protein [Aquiluna sp. KACHI24]|uniref:putative PEP-binding protein n=1 Tax=Aquiluna sp. KACHI24 TaxID=2968831 RepID=UPI00222E6047|nr:putative PEP-binding protein [Aquiluna sp. KACHI24]
MATAGAILSGMGVGLNAVRAEVFRVKPAQELPKAHKHQGDSEGEKSILKSAVSAVAEYLDHLGEKAGETSAEIFEALKMLLEDEDLFETAAAQIDEGWSAATAFLMAVDEFGELLSGDAAFEERLADLRDLAKRVAAHIHGIHLGLDLPEEGAFVLVGEDFSPADTAQFTKAVVGVVTLKGGPTSHTAIICRSKSIPAVVSCSSAADLIDGQMVLVDPVGDRVVVDGDESMATKSISFVAKSVEPIIPVRANIGSLSDAITAATTAANGVGLFRTELLYLSATAMPTVESQADSYTEILKAAPEGPVVVRTIDAGSDKPVPFLNMPHEENPALGVRGYRLIQEHRQFILDQLASLEIARERSGREVWVMAPMIATSQEALEFAGLAKAAGKFKVGVMVETPSMVFSLGDLAGQLDFISVGTNDLSQYLFAADRMNAALGALLNPWQPALIRALEKIAADSLSGNISSGVCGESASDPAFAVVLAGLGFKSVSSSMSQVGAVRTALSAVTHEQAESIAQLALSATTAEEAKSKVLAALANL